MAAEHLKSAFVTNATASPRVASNPQLRGPLMEAIGYVAPAAAAEANSTYGFFRVPSRARMSELLVTAADFTTAGTVHIGLRRTAEDGGAVVDADYFASSLDLSGGPLAASNQLKESAVNTEANSEKPIWEILGLSADPGLEYEVYATVTVAFNGGQPITLKGRWVE